MPTTGEAFSKPAGTSEYSLQTLFDAWRSGALTPGYMQKTLSDLARQMAQIEADDLVPPGWKASWDRYAVSRIFVYYSSYHAYPRCHCCKRERAESD